MVSPERTKGKVVARKPTADKLLDKLVDMIWDHLKNLPPAKRERAIQEFERIGRKAVAREKRRKKRQSQRRQPL